MVRTEIRRQKQIKTVTIIDTVSYKNLTPGLTYQVSGVLMDKSTGAELLINGEAVNGQTEFVPESAEGTVDVTFTFNAEGLAGKEVVVIRETASYVRWESDPGYIP